MFREMRRKDRQMAREDAEQILQAGSYGVLGVIGTDGYPYTVPLNYVFEAGRLYFHCAREGEKLDAIRRSPNVSFCVVADAAVQRFTTRYRSVIAFGRARILPDTEKRTPLRALNAKYAPTLRQEGETEIQHAWDAVQVVEITIAHLSGKSSRS